MKLSRHHLAAELRERDGVRAWSVKVKSGTVCPTASGVAPAAGHLLEQAQTGAP
jgi:hypothetical protein